MAKVRQYDLTSNGSYKLVRVCEKRENALSKPKNITQILETYRPFDEFHTQALDVSNMLGMKLPQFKLKSGQIYDGYDGKRIIYEVGCDTVIYLLIDRISPRNSNIFIQHMDNFVWDVTNRSVANKVVQSTAPIKTIVKYEMYFILGVLSTASLVALVAITSVDIGVTSILSSRKALAAKNLSKDLLDEHGKMAEYAPTLHQKLEEFFIAEAKVKWKSFGKQLPETIVKDEKTQAQLAGVLIGKATISPKAFNVWTAVITILSTAAIKSVTKSPEAYGRVIEGKYRPIVEELNNADLRDPKQAIQAARKLKTLVEDSGVSLTEDEALQIIKEVVSNPMQLSESLKKIDKSFKEFLLVLND
ncbi:hypothetical protein [Teredinibacter sp. KSP-S5-2]|uniref:hypothetical protein n=1 Tax=Teredinibacter sp. KSP-S5-2 TaxID=3034506 RepID=UPI0029352D2D|nr:hypothetical protein [Teredinibacter sp. KSP-S5-2]WNO10471.1 hypothetical protein P5V12_04730 [Teredinibacter sp. KSP-S5-2]